MIISKWMIYLVNTLTSLDVMLIVISALLVITATGMFCYTLDCASECASKDTGKKKAVRTLKLALLTYIISVIIPSKETMYLMILSDYLTADNVLITKEFVISTIREIAQAIK